VQTSMPSSRLTVATKQASERYVVSNERLGKGSYSTVNRGKDVCTGKDVAVKILRLKEFEEEYLRESRILSSISHKNIVSFQHARVSDCKMMGYIFMELLPSPSLYCYIQSHELCEEEALTILYQLCDGLAHIHQSGVAHRDFKPENISYDPVTRHVTIYDFGLAYVSVDNDRECRISDPVGSPMYMAPEVLFRQEYDPFLADVWGLGITFYCMLAGDVPFASAFDIDELIEMVSAKHMPMPHGISNGVAELLNGILCFNPSHRLSVAKVKEWVASLIATSA